VIHFFLSGSIFSRSAFSRRVGAGVWGAGLVVFAGSAACGAVFASSVVADQSSGFVSPWLDPTAALGAPSRLNGVGSMFPGVLNPFNSNYEPKDIVEINTGGQLTLQFPNLINVGTGLEVGVVSNVFLTDQTGNGDNPSPASAFGSGVAGGGSAEVLVSNDGTTWHTIGTHTFDRPANAYTDLASPYTATPGNSPSDFGTPFTHPISDFDGKTFAQTLALFGSSGGGTWLDLASSGLSTLDYIQFKVPTGKLVIDSVAINNADVGAAVPEPASIAMIVLAGGLFARRRRVN
jgi:hypothetical protein